MARYGYIRVSSEHQNELRQVESLKQFVDNERKLYIEKASGKDMDREQWQALLKALDKGDELYIHELSRLGRNKQQVKETLAKLKSIGVLVRVLDIPTTLQDFPKGQEWVMELVNNILIEVYTSIAEQERLNMLKRQGEGIKIAKENGKYKGSAKKHTIDKEFIKQYNRVKEKQINVKEACTLLNISRQTWYRLKNEYEGNDKTY